MSYFFPIWCIGISALGISNGSYGLAAIVSGLGCLLTLRVPVKSQ